MRKSGFAIAMTILCLVILTCLMAGCAGFGPGIPGIGPAGTGPGGSGDGGTGGGAGSGGSGSGSGGGGGYGGGGGPGNGGGGSAASECNPYTPMHTYFAVTCHYHSELRDVDWGSETEDITLTGDIPIEMIREWEKYGMDNFASAGAKMDYQYTKHRTCGRLEENCGDCKYTYRGPAFGDVKIRRADAVTTSNWMADFVFDGPKHYSTWISLFDPNNFSPFDCPPRLGWYVVTGGTGPNIPPADVQQSLPGCTDDYSQDDMNQMVENAQVVCEPIDWMPFVLRDGEVITYKLNDYGNERDYRTCDATYTFHITAR